MANITLLGASYTDVPAVDLPKTGGGTVRFYENGGGGMTVTDVPNSTGTGTVVTGTVLSNLTTKSITQNGTYDAEDDNVDGYSSVTVNVTNQDYNDALTAFGVQSNLASGITALTTYANEITGESDTNLSDAVRSLADGYGQGSGSATPPWVSSVETVTIGANSVSNTNGVKTYFNSYTPYFAIVLKSAPTTNNQIVAMVNDAASALRYRSGAVGIAGVSTAYDAKLIEGTQYDIYHY